MALGEVTITEKDYDLVLGQVKQILGNTTGRPVDERSRGGGNVLLRSGASEVVVKDKELGVSVQYNGHDNLKQRFDELSRGNTSSLDRDVQREQDELERSMNDMDGSGLTAEEVRRNETTEVFGVPTDADLNEVANIVRNAITGATNKQANVVSQGGGEATITANGIWAFAGKDGDRVEVSVSSRNPDDIISILQRLENKWLTQTDGPSNGGNSDTSNQLISVNDDGSITFTPPFTKNEADYKTKVESDFDNSHKKCRSCSHFIEGGGCHLVQGQIDEQAYCGEFYADVGLYGHRHTNMTELNLTVWGESYDWDSEDVDDFMDRVRSKLSERSN